ncbi:hypothetical protein [Dongia sp.]|uniref:hypothetical protein n=1 Tax=Dongia sp. TaxID=1977262 RepID=UPI0035B1F581
MAGTLLGSEDQALSGTSKRSKYSLLGSFNANANESEGAATRNADAIDTARSTGVSPSFSDFAQSATIGSAAAGPLGPLRAAVAIGVGGMPNNYNQNPGWNAAFDKNLKKVQQDFPGMPGSFHGTIAAQRAAAELERADKDPDKGKKQGDKPAGAGATAGGGRANPGNTTF